MSWLDNFFAPGILSLQLGGVPLPQEQILNFASGFTAADDPTNGRTNLTATGGGGGGSYYQTVESNGVPVTQQPTINFIGATVANNSGSSRTDVTIQGGPTVLATATTSQAPSAAAWTIQPVDTSSGSVTVTANASSAVGAIFQIPDAASGGSFGTNAMTFNGGGYNVDDPYNASAAPASTWSSPAGFQKICPGWILLADKSGTKVWRRYAAC